MRYAELKGNFYFRYSGKLNRFALAIGFEANDFFEFGCDSLYELPNLYIGSDKKFYVKTENGFYAIDTTVFKMDERRSSTMSAVDAYAFAFAGETETETAEEGFILCGYANYGGATADELRNGGRIYTICLGNQWAPGACKAHATTLKEALAKAAELNIKIDLSTSTSHYIASDFFYNVGCAVEEN